MTSLHGRDRNKPCACGSGVKTKRCCGSPVAILGAQRIAFERRIEERREEIRRRNLQGQRTSSADIMMLAAMAAAMSCNLPTRREL